MAQIAHLDPRLVRETIEIRRRDHCMNLHDGKKLSHTWNNIISSRKVSPPILEDDAAVSQLTTPSLHSTFSSSPAPIHQQNQQSLLSAISSLIYHILTRSQTKALQQQQ